MPTPGGSTTPVTLWVASGSALGSWVLDTHSCIAYMGIHQDPSFNLSSHIKMNGLLVYPHYHLAAPYMGFLSTCWAGHKYEQEAGKRRAMEVRHCAPRYQRSGVS